MFRGCLLYTSKEGLLYRQNSPNYFNSHDEEYFYGFENNYGASVKRIIGYGETDGAREGLYQISPVGIASKPSKMFDFDAYSICLLYTSSSGR